jgi:transcriptional regulator with XRE-family HTH domain
MTHKRQPFEYALEAFFMNEDQQLSAFVNEQEAAHVFAAKVETAPLETRISAMLEKLTGVLSKQSLGGVVAQSIADNRINVNQLHEKTGLTPSMVDAIKNDMVFTNSIPVKSLAKLLKVLGLSLDTALKAIQVTFDKLQTENRAAMSVPFSLQPSFRKGMTRGELGKDLSHLKSDESYLYQNEQALGKYTNRLSELYQNI